MSALAMNLQPGQPHEVTQGRICLDDSRIGVPTAQQVPVAANPQGTDAFSGGANDGVSSVVESTVIVMVSPAPPLLLYVLVG